MHPRHLILALYLCVSFHFCVAQADGYGTFPTDMSRYSEQPNKGSLPDSIYRFPSFEYGRITLDTGFSPEEQLRFNYNLFTGEVDMINNKGDTVTVKRFKELKFISIADHSFLHSYKIGYIEVLQRSTVSLGVLNLIFTVYPKTTVYPNTENPSYKTQGLYYFIDKGNNPYKAAYASILKLFYDQKKQVKAYIKENEVDFNNKRQLMDLLTFCNDINSNDGK